jgi:hypothetical protein
MDEKTLCPAAIRAFDGKDSPQMQEFLRFVQNVFEGLDDQSRENGEPALKAKLRHEHRGVYYPRLLPSASNADNLRSDNQRLPKLEGAAQAYDRRSHRETGTSDSGYVSLPIVLSDIICSPAEVQAGSSTPTRGITQIRAAPRPGHPDIFALRYVRRSEFRSAFPVSQFWAVTVYNSETQALFLNSERPTLDSLDKGMRTNADGSVDIYMGPKAPATVQCQRTRFFTS